LTTAPEQRFAHVKGFFSEFFANENLYFTGQIGFFFFFEKLFLSSAFLLDFRDSRRLFCLQTAPYSGLPWGRSIFLYFAPQHASPRRFSSLKIISAQASVLSYHELRKAFSAHAALFLSGSLRGLKHTRKSPS